MNNTYCFFSTCTKAFFTIVCLLFFTNVSHSQEKSNLSFFSPPDSLHKKRFYTTATFSTVTYSGFSYGLYNTWYKQYDQEAFHLYNDLGEWRNMDKFGHFYTAYFQGVLCYKGAKWTGLNENQSIFTGFFLGTLFQTTLEVMDGFSSNWGFSLPDMSMNLLGSSAFVLQQKYWQDQRIIFKVSNVPKSYSQETIFSVDGTATSSLANRAADLYGSSLPEKFLKDYNSQVIWTSINISSFLDSDTNFPSWLNVAIGYGAGNMFGGYENTWTENGVDFKLDNKYKRYSSFYLSPDIDFWKVRTKYESFNTLLDMFNIFKIPAPAIEINTLGEFHFHFFI